MNIHGQHFLCSQINLLLPREASGTSAYCNVPRDSHFALLLNQERVQSFSVSWMLNIQRKRLLFTRKHLFPKFFFLLLTATSFQPFFLDDCTMSSQWNYIREMRLYVVIIITSVKVKQSFPPMSRTCKLVTVEEKAEVLKSVVAFQYLKKAYKKDGESFLAGPCRRREYRYLHPKSRNLKWREYHLTNMAETGIQWTSFS